MKHVVKVDIGSKQKYIFSSNRLKEIIGASEIIKYVTEGLGEEVLKSMNKNPENYTGDNNGNRLFGAGGNAMYIFDKKDDAINFNKIFSKFVIKYFDGLELLMVIKEFDIQNKNIVTLHSEIEECLTRKKGKRKYQFRRLGYGLSRICSNTRKPAGYPDELSDDKDKYISKESKDKLSFYNFIYKHSQYYDKENRIKYMIGSNEIEKKEIQELIEQNNTLKNKFKFTDEIEAIAGKKNEGSYIGITCIDGNGMGKKIDSFNNEYKNIPKEKIFESNKKYIKKFRDLTQRVKCDYKKAFKQTVEDLIDNYNNYYKEIGYEEEGKVVPLRPIILAGDDITFISNGKIAIDVARIFTEKITKVKEKFGEKKYNLTTSAGIAIVKKNHPFSRAVKLAGDLEKSSKKKLRKMTLAFKEEKIKGEKDASFIDWEVNRGDTTDEISIKRDKNVVARPYIIVPKTEEEIKKSLNDIKDETLKNIINYNFYTFDDVFESINQSGAKSNLKSFFRTMNSEEIDAELFYLKYDLQNKIKSDVDSYVLKQVVYDAIDVMDLYTYVKDQL